MVKTENKMVKIIYNYTDQIIKVLQSTPYIEKLVKLATPSQQRAIQDIQDIDTELSALENQLGVDLVGIMGLAVKNAYRQGRNRAQQQVNRIQTHPTQPRLSRQDQQTILLLQNTNFGLVRSLSAHHVAIAKDIFIDGMANGLSNREIKHRIMAATGGTEYQIRRIIRTELTRTSNIGAKKRYIQTGMKYWQWNTSIDERVCEICGQLHGKVVNIGESFTPLLTGQGQKNNKGKTITMPPAHPNCRCGMSPAFRKNKIKKPVSKKPKPKKPKIKMKGFSNKDKKAFKKHIAILPSQVRNSVDSLNGKVKIVKTKGDIVDDKEFKHLVTQDIVNNYRNATGIYLGDSKRIFVKNGTGINELLHETGHTIYNQYVVRKKSWVDIWKNNKGNGYLPTLRSALNPDEAFSDAFRFYLTKPRWLEKEFPDMYKYMKDSVFLGNTKEKIVSLEEQVIIEDVV